MHMVFLERAERNLKIDTDGFRGIPYIQIDMVNSQVVITDFWVSGLKQSQ